MRPRPTTAIRFTLAALVALAANVGRLHGQVLVVPERDLDFGLISAGVPAAVQPTDVVRSAQLRVEGRGRYQISFLLPTHLSSLSGHTIPLVFGATDGRLTIRHKVTTFDPADVVSFRINPADREATVNLGGTATPATGQPAGSYSATIVIMIVQTGN